MGKLSNIDIVEKENLIVSSDTENEGLCLGVNEVMARIGGREDDNKKKVQIHHDVFVQGKYLSYISTIIITILSYTC